MFNLSVTFLPKNRNLFTCQSYCKPKVGLFLRHGVHTVMQPNK